MSKLLLLLQKDFRVIYRDGFIAFLFLFPVLVGLVTRVLVPWVPLPHVELYVAPWLVQMCGPMLGTVLGYALIEEREQQTWLLLRVLPLSQTGLFAYLVGLSSLLTVALCLVATVAYGVPPAQPAALVAHIVASAPTALLMTLLLGAATQNKVQGLAISKPVSSVGLLPLLVFVLPVPWQVLLWWNPFYWLYVGLLGAYAGDRVAELPLYWPALPVWSTTLVPAALALGISALLARVYRRRAE